MQTPVCFRAMPFGNKFNQAETGSIPGGGGAGWIRPEPSLP